MNKQIVKNAVEADQAFKEHQAKISMLREKARFLDASLPGLKTAIETAAEVKQKALDDFCLDLCGQADLESAQKAYDEAVQAVNNAEELLAAVNAKVGTAEKDRLRLMEIQRHKIAEVWTILRDESIADLQKEIGNKVVYAFAVNRRSLTPVSFTGFLQTIFSATQDDINSFNSELDEKLAKIMK